MLVTLANLVGIIVKSHNPVSQTISRLAIGEYAWIQDLGLDAYAIGIFALTIGLYLSLDKTWRTLSGFVLLILLSVDILLIAEHNQYLGRPGRGEAIHIYLVYALYALVALIPMLLAKALSVFGERWRRRSWIFATLWLVLAPFFFVVPDNINGGVERLLALFLLFGVGFTGWQLMVTQSQESGRQPQKGHTATS